MSQKLLDAVRRREQAKIHPAPVKPARKAKRPAPEPPTTEPGDAVEEPGG